jgi:hypothetical protein
VAVVTCDSKYQLRGDYTNRRSCRAPLVDEIEAEFNMDNAKLFWSVSVDGKKSETYKIISSATALSESDFYEAALSILIGCNLEACPFSAVQEHYSAMNEAD